MSIKYSLKCIKILLVTICENYISDRWSNKIAQMLQGQNTSMYKNIMFDESHNTNQ